ncbi:unnamed protein product [Cylicocyclus nassatus]|uniref:Uncharacterized protein n=1 Tax=Cylicocyclus nassatus TaxID=53992 RepID=A0AA36M9U4_CYLNA|nr:unnamed protein product [Cylicocyclus nassatus]
MADPEYAKFERPAYGGTIDLDRQYRSLSLSDRVIMSPVYVPKASLNKDPPIRDIHDEDYYKRQFNGDSRNHNLAIFDEARYGEDTYGARTLREDTYGARENFYATKGVIDVQTAHGSLPKLPRLPKPESIPNIPETYSATRGFSDLQTYSNLPKLQQMGRIPRLPVKLEDKTTAKEERERTSDEFGRVNDARVIISNPQLGYQRMLFIFAKYPALITAMVALWCITGRGQGMKKTKTENAAYYISLIMAIFVLISQLPASIQHHYSLKKVKILSYFCHGSMVFTSLLALLVILFASLNFTEYTGKEGKMTCKYTDQCYTYTERVAYLGTLVGCSVVIISFAIDTFVYGGFGLSHLRRRRVVER